jgi:hypothetical protein
MEWQPAADTAAGRIFRLVSVDQVKLETIQVGFLLSGSRDGLLS